MKKILILYTSVGLGHKYIAENIAYHLEAESYKILMHDILQVQDGALVNFGVWLHSFINRRLPFVWRWLYFSKFVNLVSLPLRIPLAKSNSKNLEAVILQFAPDCIISTQTAASAAVASLIEQQKYLGKFVIAFSDYHLHQFWLYHQADLYLANTEEQKQEMITLGVDQTKIAVAGITLKPLSPVNKNDLKQKLGIPLNDRIIIFGSGSLGIGFDYNMLKSFLQKITSAKKNITVVVLCGKNEGLREALKQLSMANVLPLGFYNNPTGLYQIGDLLLTKPGGLTTAEALQAGIKILITHTLPGQEEPNYRYLVEKELVAPMPQPLTANQLTTDAIKLLDSHESSGETIKGQYITQYGQEGHIVTNAIKRLFHTQE